MPYGSTADLAPAIRDRYSARCARAFIHAFNSAYAEHGESRAFAIGHAAAKRCEEANKSMDTNTRPIDFKVFSMEFEPLPSTGDGKLRVRTIASSSIEDEAGDVVTPEALKAMAESAKGMTIFRNHSYKVPGDIFGTVERAWAEPTQAKDGKGKAIWQMPMDIVLFEGNPDNVQTHRAVESGVRLGTSIGAKIPEGGAMRNTAGGYTFSDLRLKEASIVGIPQNPLSLVQYATKAMKAAEDEDEAEDTNQEFVTASGDSSTGGDVASTVTSTVKSDPVPPSPPQPPSPEPPPPPPAPPQPEATEVAKADEHDHGTLDEDIDWANLPVGDQDAADALYAEYDLIDKSDTPDLVKAPLVARVRENLPEGQFACPTDRMYPIHDKAHIRNALARCADTKQCSYDRIRDAARRAGIEEPTKATDLTASAEPTVLKAEQESGSPAQEPSGDPENAEKALSDDILTKSTDVLTDLVKSLSMENSTLRKQYDTAVEERNQARRDADEAKANAEFAINLAMELANTPLARKGVLHDVESELQKKFGGIYSPKVIKMLENTNGD